jgi:phosphoribosyl-ATP pyrophosphohydrolase
MAKTAKKKIEIKPKKAAKAKIIAPALLSQGVLDRLFGVVLSRRDADPSTSHSARLLSRGTAKVAQKFGEEAVECLIEAVAGNKSELIGESADVLYHLMVLWVASGVTPDEVWAELGRREGISGITEKASRGKAATVAPGAETAKIP